MVLHYPVHCFVRNDYNVESHEHPHAGRWGEFGHDAARIYFLSFFMNGRQAFTAQKSLFIGGSMACVFFPLLGVYVCYDMIQTGTMDMYAHRGYKVDSNYHV